MARDENENENGLNELNELNEKIEELRWVKDQLNWLDRWLTREEVRRFPSPGFHLVKSEEERQLKEAENALSVVRLFIDNELDRLILSQRRRTWRQDP